MPRNNYPCLSGRQALSAIRYTLCSIFLLLAVNGCGYTTRSIVSNKFHTINISHFISKIDITQDNYTANKYKIYRPGLETDVTRIVTNKFLFDGNLRPVKEGSADVALKGELVDFRKDPLRYADNGTDVIEYRVNVVVNIELRDVKEDKLLWQENNFTGSSEFFITGTQAKSEAQAISDCIDDLARRIVERAVEQW